MRKFYAFMLFAVLSLSAFAEGDGKYYWFYDKVEAAPTGKGVVYASDGAEPASDSDYAASMEVKFNVYNYSFAPLHVWAKPATGYQFIGWFTPEEDMTVNDLTMAYQTSTEPETSLNVDANQSSDDDVTEHYGFEPDATFYALFSKVNVKMAKGLETAGSVEISKLMNDTDDEVTIEATPAEEGIKFEYWINSKGEKITQNPYKFTVKEMDTYTAYFSGDKILEIDFEDGKFIPFSNALSAAIGDLEGYRIIAVSQTFSDGEGNTIEFDETENAWGYWNIETDPETYEEISREFVKYTGEIPTFDSSYEVQPFGYNYNATDGVILHGTGKHFIVLYKDEFYTPWNNTFLMGTSDGPCDLSALSPYDLDGTTPLNYYVFDGQDFVKTKTGVVPQNQCYLVLDGNQYPLPDKVVFATSEAVGVEEVPAAQPVQFKGIYTIDGKQVVAPVKGINIIDGRKVWVKE